MGAPECAAVRAMLGGEPFVHMARGEDGLMVSDAPRRLDALALAEGCDRLRAAGYVFRPTEQGLLAIDWNERRWVDFAGDALREDAPAIPEDDAQHPLYALFMLLHRHPASADAQPRALLRTLVKASMRKDGLESIALPMLETCAQRLRRHEALPSAARRMILRALSGREGQTEVL